MEKIYRSIYYEHNSKTVYTSTIFYDNKMAVNRSPLIAKRPHYTCLIKRLPQNSNGVKQEKNQIIFSNRIVISPEDP